ncbi:MAG: tetratricopeptide repeat protein [Phycisphaerae bacterium]|nr:tetratricopeptide repeat protein [Phycisphaerae bacterium]
MSRPIKTGRRGKVRSRVLLLVAVGAGVLFIAAGTAIQIRKRVLAARGLVQGRLALDQGQWSRACEQLGRYLARHPNDTAVLKEYARAQLLVRPLELGNVGAAIRAYRQVLRDAPRDDVAFERLAALYDALENHSEVIYVAGNRLKHLPSDPKASLWLAKAYEAQQKLDEERGVLAGMIDTLETESVSCQEYVEACRLMSNLDLVRSPGDPEGTARAWLDRAIEFDPNSPRALVNRAQFLRTHLPDSQAERLAALATARQDLESAGAMQPTRASLRLLLAQEWIAHGDLDRAGAELRSIDNLDPASVTRDFDDPDDWVVSKFLVEAQLALRKGAGPEGVRMADDVLERLKYRQQRKGVLPSAIELYASGGEPARAKRCLAEYLDVTALEAASLRGAANPAYLKAIVRRAEGKPYQVIDHLLEGPSPAAKDPVCCRLLAEAYGQTGQLRQVIASIRLYLQSRPDDPTMTAQLARACLAQGDWTKALDAAVRAESLNPTDLDTTLLRTEAEMAALDDQPIDARKRRIDQIEGQLDRLKRHRPEEANVRILQALIAARRGRDDVAEATLRDAIKECDTSGSARLRLARLLARTHRAAEAAELLLQACRAFPETAAPWHAFSELQRSRRRYREAVATLLTGSRSVASTADKRSLALRAAMVEALHIDRQSGLARLRGLAEEDSQDVQVRALLLEFPEVRRDHAAARRLVDEIRTIQGERGLHWRYYQALVDLSTSRWRGRSREVTEHLRFCVDADPGWSAPVLLLGGMYERRGDPAQAEQIYRRCLAINPNATDVADRLVTMLEGQNRLAEARDLIEQVDVSWALEGRRRVRTALQAGRLSEAIDELRGRVGENPNDLGGRISLARLVYEQTKDADTALSYLDEAEAIAPHSMAVTAARVGILKMQDRLPEAKRVLDRRVERDNAPESILLRATFLAGTGRPDLAEKDYLRLIELMPDGQGEELLGGFYANTERLDEAITVWSNGLSAHPENLSLKRRLMTRLFRRDRDGDRALAVRLLGELEQSLPDDPDLLDTRAALLLSEGTEESNAEARVLLERVVKLRPTAVNAHLKLIEMVADRGDHAAARDVAVRALGANPSNVRLHVVRAREEVALNNLSTARELARAALTHEPSDVEACEVLTHVAVASRDLMACRTALADVRAALWINPQDERLRVARAKLQSALGKTSEAIADLETYTGTDDGKRSAKALLMLAELYRLQGDGLRGGECVERAADVAPDTPDVTRARIVWMGERRELDKILELVSERRGKGHADVHTLFTAGFVLATARDERHAAKAMELFEEVVAKHPRFFQAHLALAAMAYQTGNPDRAEELCRTVLKADPRHPQALNDLAWILAEARGQHETALELADRAIRIDPENRSLRDTRGVILSKLPGRLADARADFEKCIELTSPETPNRAKALYRLGGVCVRLEDFAVAKRHLTQALRIDQVRPIFTPRERQEIAKLLDSLPKGLAGRGSAESPRGG